MVMLGTRFLFSDRLEEAVKAEKTLDEYKINNSTVFKRVPLKEEDLKKLQLTFEKTKVGWRKSKPLSSGTYKVRYNNVDYYMSFLDELDLFTLVVLQQ